MTAQWLAESGGSGTSLPEPSSDSPVWGGKSSSGLEETEQSDSLVCLSTSFVQVGCWLAALVELLVFPALGAADDAALFQSGLTKETVAHFLFLSISGRNHTHTPPSILEFLYPRPDRKWSRPEEHRWHALLTVADVQRCHLFFACEHYIYSLD